MSGVQSIGGPSPASREQRDAAGRAAVGSPPHGPAPAGDPGPGAVPAFDAFAALVQAARGAEAPPPAGLQARLLDWAAPTARQFEAVSPARLPPLLNLAVGRLAEEPQRGDELDQLGAMALERELHDYQALAERRATLIKS